VRHFNRIAGIIFIVLSLLPRMSFAAASDYKVGADGTVNAYDVITKGPWVDVRKFATLYAAANAPATANRLLVVSDTQTLTANVTISGGRKLLVLPGGLITAGSYTVTLPAGSTVEADWFSGGFQGAVAALGSTQPVTLTVSSAQSLTATTTVPSNISLVITNGGSITQTGAYTLTINGPFKAEGSGALTGFRSEERRVGKECVSTHDQRPVQGRGERGAYRVLHRAGGLRNGRRAVGRVCIVER
jgi:hypothetical protein